MLNTAVKFWIYKRFVLPPQIEFAVTFDDTFCHSRGLITLVFKSGWHHLRFFIVNHICHNDSLSFLTTLTMSRVILTILNIGSSCRFHLRFLTTTAINSPWVTLKRPSDVFVFWSFAFFHRNTNTQYFDHFTDFRFCHNDSLSFLTTLIQ